MNQQDKQRYLENWNDERNSMAIYQSLADTEKDPRLAEIYKRMVTVELKHAEKWEQYLKEGGETIPPFRISWRTRTLIWLAKRLGPELVLPSVQGMEQNGTTSYSQQIEAKDMVADENSHARILNQITGSMRGGMAGAALKQLEGRHRSGGGNALRAAVLGANDGLVSNLSLVMGVAGAAFENRTVMITGLAGLLAGAISMALGEWLSVQSSRELYENQIRIERQEISSAPEEEAAEMALIYESRGLPREQAQTLSNQIMSNRETALDTLAREELGIDPEELGGSAWEAAITSFLLFSIGAIVPVMAFIFLKGMPAVVASIISSTIGLFLVGAATSLFTGKKLLYSGMRMVVFGLIAAAVTFGIGRLIGGGIAG